MIKNLLKDFFVFFVLICFFTFCIFLFFNSNEKVNHDEQDCSLSSEFVIVEDKYIKDNWFSNDYIIVVEYQSQKREGVSVSYELYNSLEISDIVDYSKKCNTLTIIND